MTKNQMWCPKHPQNTQIEKLRNTINNRYNLSLNNYDDLHAWSVRYTELFWEVIWEENACIFSETYSSIIDNPKKMPGATWFKGARLNYAENLLRYRDDHTALHIISETEAQETMSYKELYKHVEKLTAYLRKMGVKKGDRVAAILPNSSEAVIGMLATTAIGAIWSSCSPDFGAEGMCHRFEQIEPVVLIAVNAYKYKNKYVDCSQKVNDCLTKILTIKTVIVVKKSSDSEEISHSSYRFFDAIMKEVPASQLVFEQVPFDHPIVIVYSSGTTGKPKCIVHGAGGILLQHLKEHRYHCDLKRNDVMMYFTTCGWMMWNWLMGGLAIGASLVLYDGAPFYPEKNILWKLVDDLKISVFGTSAKYLSACEKNKQVPRDKYALNSLRLILSTGSPLLPEQFDYVYTNIKEDVQLSSISGGTDILSCFLLGNPALPVNRGEIQCKGLGMDVHALDNNGKKIIGKRGELVCQTAFPAQPIMFWNDTNNFAYKQAYFNDIENTWSHGDYITVNKNGGCVIWGRSDSTLNPGGIRIGTAEIYRVVEAIDGISDSLVIGKQEDGDEKVILFITMKESYKCDSKLRILIRKMIKEKCSPRHVPNTIIEVPEIPYTRSGKKVEIAVKKIINGESIDNVQALSNPDSLVIFEEIAKQTNKV
jgi:acetoacetyl-CoA synthetase